MSFIRSRSEQLADYLRSRIQKGELLEPLPGTRLWSRNLGVARTTLNSALQILQREGMLKTHARGCRLNLPASAGGDPPQEKRKKDEPRLVRMLFYVSDYPDLDNYLELIFLLSERLRKHGIQFQVEKCSDTRLRTIAMQENSPNELHFLASLAPRHQALFARVNKPCMVVGSPATGVELPFITLDQAGAVLHATQRLLRNGHSTVSLVTSKLSAPGLEESTQAFQAACEKWPHQPVNAQSVLVPMDEVAQRASARRFAARLEGRRGIVVVGPVPVSMILTALLERGIAVPDQAEIIAVLPPFRMVSFCPPIRYYSMPIDRCVKAMVALAVHFFESGVVLPIYRRFPLELVPISR